MSHFPTQFSPPQLILLYLILNVYLTGKLGPVLFLQYNVFLLLYFLLILFFFSHVHCTPPKKVDWPGLHSLCFSSPGDSTAGHCVICLLRFSVLHLILILFYHYSSPFYFCSPPLLSINRIPVIKFNLKK